MPMPSVIAASFLSSALVNKAMKVHSRRIRSMGSVSGPMGGDGRLRVTSERRNRMSSGASSSRAGASAMVGGRPSPFEAFPLLAMMESER